MRKLLIATFVALLLAGCGGNKEVSEREAIDKAKEEIEAKERELTTEVPELLPSGDVGSLLAKDQQALDLVTGLYRDELVREPESAEVVQYWANQMKGTDAEWGTPDDKSLEDIRTIFQAGAEWGSEATSRARADKGDKVNKE